MTSASVMQRFDVSQKMCQNQSPTLLVEIAQLCNQAAERLVREFRKQRDRALVEEIELPYQFEYQDRQFSVSEHATTLSDVQLIERPVTLSFTLWDRIHWVKRHSELYNSWVYKDVERQQRAYAPEHTTYFLQYEGPSEDLLWCGDLIEQQLLEQDNRQGFFISRSALLTPADSDAKWLRSARKLSGAVLFEPEDVRLPRFWRGHERGSCVTGDSSKEMRKRKKIRCICIY